MGQYLDLTDTASSDEHESTVLLVEDRPSDARLVTELLNVAALQVLCIGVETIGEATEVLHAQPIDCVLLDLSLPDAKGLAGLSAIQASAPNVPIVVITALDDDATGEAAIQLGAQDYITKLELTPELLARSVRYAMERNRQHLALVEARDGLAREVGVRIRAEEELRLSRNRLAALVAHASDIIAVADGDGFLRTVSPAASRLLGWDIDDLVGKSWLALVHGDDRAAATELLGHVVDHTGSAVPHELRLQGADGDWRSVEVVANNRVDDPAVAGIVLSIRDIGARRQAEAAQRHAERRFRSAFEHAAIGMLLLTLEGRIADTNPAIREMLGYREAELASMDLETVSHPDDVERLRVTLSSLVQSEVAAFRTEQRLVAADGREVWVRISAGGVAGPYGELEGLIAQIEDISDQKRAELALLHQSLHDPLTGLPNRLLLHDRLCHALARHQRRPDAVALLFLDLDRFKLVNDSLGHETGDLLLVEVAQRLQAAVRPSDTVARIGGDEFVVLAEDLSGLDEAVAIGERVRDAVSQPWPLKKGQLVPAVSIGVAVARERRTPEQLLREADMAMYQAKERGKDRVELFDDALRARAMARLGTETLLRAALEAEHLVLVYQPIIDLRTGVTTSVEALLRVDHPEAGLLAPAEFLEVAEDTGLIVPLGRWVLSEAFRQAAEWRKGMHHPVRIAVNLSARQLAMPDLAATAEELLAHHELQPDAVSFELTESILMEASPSASREVARLHAAGFALAIDDFGTGYSSLTYLRRFPVDVIKIDRGFVQGLPSNSEDLAIVRAVVSLGNALGLMTVAEGVETADQLACLRELGCPLAQGYQLCPPVTFDVLETRLDDIFAG